MSEPYIPQSQLLARLLQQQQEQDRVPVRSIGQGLANVAGDLGTAWAAKSQQQQQAAALSALLTKLMPGAAQDQSGNSGTIANGMFTPGGQSTGAVPGSPGMQYGQMSIPADAPTTGGIPGGVGAQQLTMAQRLASAAPMLKDPKMMAALPQAMSLAQAVTPKVSWVDVGGKKVPVDENGQPVQGMDAMQTTLTPYQTASLGQEAQTHADAIAMEKAQLAETTREHNITAQQGRIKFEKDMMGNLVPFDTQTNKVVDPKTIGLPENMSEQNAASTAQQIYEYRKKPLSGFVLKTPYGQMVQDEINKLDSQGQATGTPAYNEQYYDTSQKARTAFATGQQGNQVRSANVATHHLLMLNDLGQALDNGDIQTINRLKNALSNEFGGKDIASYDAIAPLVGEEVSKFIMGGKSSAGERQQFVAPLVSARGQAQRQAAIGSLVGAMGAQLKGYQQQYEQSVRSKDFGNLLDPQVAKILNSGQMPGVNAPAAPGAGGVTRVPSPTLTNDAAGKAAYDALKPGDQYIDPTGVHRTKQ